MAGQPFTKVIQPDANGRLSFEVPAYYTVDLESVLANVDTSAAGDTTATLIVSDQAGEFVTVVAQTRTIPGGGQGRATWALRLADEPGDAGYVTVQDEGIALAQRGILDFEGAGVTATDDAPNGRTKVTIPAGGTPTIEDEGIALPLRSILNFIGAGVTAADDPGSVRTNISIPGALPFFVAYQPNVEAGTFGVSPDWEAVYGYATNVFGTLPVTIGGTSFGPTLRGPRAIAPTRNSEIRLPFGRWLVIFGVNPDPVAPTNVQNQPRLFAGTNFDVFGNPIAAPVWRVAEQTSENVNNKSFAVAVANFASSSRAIEANIGASTFLVGNNTPPAFPDERNVGCTLVVVKLG